MPQAEYRGDLLAERSEPFTLEAEDDGEQFSIRGTFTSPVYRDAGTGGLAFLYLRHAAPPVAAAPMISADVPRRSGGR